MRVTKQRITLVVLVLAATGGLVYPLFWVRHQGFSAREKPSWLESLLARHARRIATPAGAGERKNPWAATPQSLAAAREHFVAHCATCHGLDGRGNTVIGRNLYPKVPDMTAPGTQRLSDGEMFYVISNGVRLTGMPAWGGEDSPQSIWELVAFIRRLPGLSPEELRLMQQQAAEEGSETEGTAPKRHAEAPGAAPHKH